MVTLMEPKGSIIDVLCLVSMGKIIAYLILVREHRAISSPEQRMQFQPALNPPIRVQQTFRITQQKKTDLYLYNFHLIRIFSKSLLFNELCFFQSC